MQFLEALRLLKQEKRFPFEVSEDHLERHNLVFIKYTNASTLAKAEIDLSFDVGYDNIYVGFDKRSGKIKMAFPENSYLKQLASSYIFPHMCVQNLSNLNINPSKMGIDYDFARSASFCEGSGEFATLSAWIDVQERVDSDDINKFKAKVLLYINMVKHYLLVQSSAMPYWKIERSLKIYLNNTVFTEKEIDISDYVRTKVQQGKQYVDDTFYTTAYNRFRGYTQLRVLNENAILPHFYNQISKNLKKSGKVSFSTVSENINSFSFYYHFFKHSIPVITFNGEEIFIKAIGETEKKEEDITISSVDVSQEVRDEVIKRLKKQSKHIIYNAAINMSNVIF